jgi:type VI secretion system secreted protein VgrG
MTFQGETRYSFVSSAKPEETFMVVRFTGRESISQPYRFDIILASEDAEIDLRAMLQNSARFVIHRSDLDDRVFHGVLAEFEQMEEAQDLVIYRAALVPRLWNAGLFHENQLFLDKSVQDIIADVLQQTQLTGQDYEFRLTNTYNPWEYICQWRETDLNFIHRWMEREGIYYYFTQDDEQEKIIITDSSTSHENIPDEHQLPYSPPSATVPRHEEVVQSLVCRQSRLPNKVILRDYNYRRPSLELRAEAIVDSNAHGDVYFYGEHFKTPEEGSALAQVRAEELLCRESIYSGESTAANLSSGFLFEVQDHYRESYNQQYLVIEVRHEGSQAIAGLSGMKAELAEGERRMEYSNRFSAIPATAQFRPQRNAEKPKFYGTLNATVDAAGSGDYAEIDDQGRYKVIMPFDQSGNDGGRASRWVRMAQPYAGNDYGMHFPLHRGTEVLLTFVDGDPDRPIIAGAVPNPATVSPVIAGNQTQSVIRTGGGNQIHMEDESGGQLMKLQSPTDKTFVRIGAADSGGPSGIEISTKANQKTSIDQKRSLEVGGDTDENYKGNLKTKTLGDKQQTTVGKTESKKMSDAKSTTVGNEEIVNLAGFKLTAVGQSEQTKVAGERALFVGSWDITGIAGNTSIWVGTKSQITIALASEVYVGGKSEIFVGAKSSISLAGAFEVFIGVKIEMKMGAFVEMVAAVKLALALSASIELAAGPKIQNTPAGIKNEGVKLSMSAISQSLSTIENHS